MVALRTPVGNIKVKWRQQYLTTNNERIITYSTAVALVKISEEIGLDSFARWMNIVCQIIL